MPVKTNPVSQFGKTAAIAFPSWRAKARHRRLCRSAMPTGAEGGPSAMTGAAERQGENRRGRTLGWFVTGFMLIAPGFSAVAQDGDGDAAKGHRLAQNWCSNCHVVDRASTTGASTGAPPFPAVAQMKSVTPMSLRVFLQSPHQRMPDLHLSRDETDDLITYILSLREK